MLKKLKKESLRWSLFKNGGTNKAGTGRNH